MNKETLEARKKRHNGVKRLVFCGISIILQVATFVSILTNLNEYAGLINIAIKILAVFLVVFIYSKNITSTMKIPWIIIILITPVLGVTLYFLTGLNSSTKKMKKRYEKIDSVLLSALPENKNIKTELNEELRRAGNISEYISRYSQYPVYYNNNLKYFSDASEALAAQMDDISRAEKYVFMEYHAIDNKQTWMKLQNLLEKKVKEGIDVRVFYDDLGSIGFVNLDFVRQLEKVGIRCRVFNPFMPFVNMFLNNRDHRKITVIDGKVGYTGGYNLADEYFNITHPYGMWKDTGIRIEGNAVMSLTAAFLEMWNAVKDSDIDDIHPENYLVPFYQEEKHDGYIQPYADSPVNGEQIGESVYISILNKSEKYCWFITPYLIITDEMINAFCLAAKRGVDVRLITPGIPDKKVIYRLTRSYYGTLAVCGVRIYEWTPGFCHAKMCVADDVMATCGTINLDYRSLYHHFENGCFMAGCEAVKDIRDDFIKTFGECREVTENYCNSSGKRLKLGQMVLRTIAELL